MRLCFVPIVFALLICCAPALLAQQPSAAQPGPGAATGQHAILLTVFLKHDESKTLDQIENELKKTGFYRDFPPPGAEIVSWYVVMGVGQVVTLRFPAERLRDVNRYFEQRAWGAFRTEFYATYDFRPGFQELKQQQGLP